jgi:DNA-binding transcriptional LysR family regulator
LFRAQSAVSKQIAALEEELGCDLFEQAGKKTLLTPAGERFLSYAERILTLTNEAHEALGDFKNGARGRISVAAIGSSTLYLLPDILYKFRVRSRDVDIVLRTAGGDEVKDMVARGVVDLGIVGSHVKTSEFASVHLFHDRISPFVNRNHPLAKRRRIRFAELASEPMVQLGPWKSWQDYIMSVFRKAGMTPQVHMQLESIDAVKRMVERGLGFTILPHIAARSEVKAGKLVPLQLTDVPSLDREILLIHRKDKQLSTVLQRFIEFVLEETQRFR